MVFPVIISYSNNGYYDFAKNMLISLDKTINFHKVHFYCLDNEIYTKLLKLEFKNIKVTFEILINNKLSKNLENYGTPNYNLITHTKMSILRHALAKYNFIHFIDCDVVCVKEPLMEHYNKYTPFDIVFQYDSGMHSANKLHETTLHHIWCCTGNTTLRNTPETILLLDKITEYQNKYQNKNDQECLYQFFRDLSIKDIREYKPTKLYTYEPREYTNGYWVNKNIGTLEDTYFFHANHVTGSIQKFNLLKKAKQYFL
jgi:hypothetical protein